MDGFVVCLFVLEGRGGMILKEQCGGLRDSKAIYCTLPYGSELNEKPAFTSHSFMVISTVSYFRNFSR